MPAQPGEVHFTWLQPVEADEVVLSPAYQRAVEAAVREVAAAAAKEVEFTGFGTHTLASVRGAAAARRAYMCCSTQSAVWRERNRRF